MKDLTIRRVVAFIIDYVLFCFIFSIITIVILTITISLWGKNGNLIFTIVFYMIGIAIVLLWAYFFIIDYYSKFDFGKRMTRIEILSHNQKFSCYIALKHSALKTLSGFIWPISFSYYLFSQKMIYDKCLEITIKDRAL